MDAPTHLLAPIGRTAGEPQLRAVEQYARALQADVLLMHVLPRPDSRKEAAARAYLDTLVDRLANAGIRAQASVPAGKLADTVIAEARRADTTAIVLGLSHRPAVLAAVVGSVSGTIERAAPCPVILVARPSGDARPLPALWDFADAAGRAGPLTRRQSRPRTVDIEHIVGSVDRSRELGADFRPRRGARRPLDDYRLDGIRHALAQGKPLPSVELYQLGSGFYVLDGHHRVAAARMLGQAAIDANVVEFVPFASPASDAARLR